MTERYRQENSGIAAKVKASSVAGSAGAVIGTVSAGEVCDFISTIGFSPNLEKYFCLGAFILIVVLTTVFAGLGAGYYTRPSKNDQIIKEN